MLKRSSKNYCIKEGYNPRINNQYFSDIKEKGLFFQPEVYELTDYLAKRSGAEYIIDIGAGNGLKLKPLAKKYKIIAVDHKSNAKDLAKNLPGQEIIEYDLERGLPHIPLDIVEKSVVLSADVIEHLKKPDKYLRGLSKLSKVAPFVLVSTPDRVKVRGVADFGPPSNAAHVREWSLDELFNLINCFEFTGATAGYTINTNKHKRKSTSLIVSGAHAGPPPKTQNMVNVQAVITLHNDSDIIEQVIGHLNGQGVAVHIIDNWSSDGSFEKVKKLAKNNPHLTFEQYPAQKPKYYEWAQLLGRVEEVTHDGKHDWYIHYDADELRVSPWLGVSLREAISFVDSIGYSAIDFTILDFRPTKDGFDEDQELSEFFTHCEFGRRGGHFTQIKAWKNTGQRVDLASSGGHEAVFVGRKVYPIKFLTKHYPLRSSTQAKKKIFNDRLPRISPEEKKKGWHIQYNNFSKEDNFVFDENSLIKFDAEIFYPEYMVELISGIGINRE